MMAATIYAEMRAHSNALESTDQVMLNSLEEADRLAAIVEARVDKEAHEAAIDAAVKRFPEDVHSETLVAMFYSSSEEPAVPANWAGGPDWAVHEAIEAIDAAIFSGDTFQGLDQIQYLEWHIGRWVREMTRTRRQHAAEQARQPAPASQPKQDECTVCGRVGHESDYCPEIPF